MSICIHIPAPPDALKVTLPGSAVIESHEPLQMLQPALAPLAPLFTVIEVVNTIKNIVEALGSLPDPRPVISELDKAGVTLDKLASILPQASIPILVKDTIKVIVAKLEETRSGILHLITRLEKLDGAMEKAEELDDAKLYDHINCARQQCQEAANNMFQGLAVLTSFVALLNTFMELIDGPELPDLGTLEGLSLDQAVEPLDTLIEKFERLGALIPTP